MTSSSVEPVGAPTTESFVRTMVTPRSRSDWMSVVDRCHSVIRDDTSAVAVVLVEAVELRPVSREPVAAVVLVDPVAAPIVPVAEVEELVLWSGLVGEVELGVVDVVDELELGVVDELGV